MTTQPVIGSLGMSDDTEIPLISTLTDGTASEVKTDAAFTVSAQSVGDYAPGKVISHAIVTAKTFIGYCYILRNGLVYATIPIGSRTAGGTGGNPLPLCRAVPLQPGDKVWAYTLA